MSKSWFGNFFEKVKNTFKSQTSQPSPPQQFPKKEYTKQEQQFIKEIFTKMTQEMKKVKNLTVDQQLVLYGLYKQATVGDCNIPQPSFYQQQKKYKYNSWTKMKGLTLVEAQQIYIQASNEFYPQISQLISGGNPNQQKVMVKSGGAFSNSVPKPKFEEQELQYDHPYFNMILNDEEIEVEKGLLLKMNSEPNILPLHFAIDNQKVKYVELFLKHLEKDEVNLADGEGMTSLEYAELIGNQEILELIKKAI